MSTTTPKLGLVKPAYSEVVDVAVLNNNFDLIDAWTVEVDASVEAVGDEVDLVAATRARSKVSSTAPTSPQVGDLWFEPI